jgi:hypothetical protein
MRGKTTRRRGETTNRRRGDQESHHIEQSRLALLWSFLFIQIVLHVYRYKPKEGLAFLGEIYIFYYDSCVMSCESFEVLSKIR